MGSSDWAPLHRWESRVLSSSRGTASAPSGKVAVCVMAMTAVLRASTVAPPAKSRERVAVDKLRAKTAKDRLDESIQRLEKDLDATGRVFGKKGNRLAGEQGIRTSAKMSCCLLWSRLHVTRRLPRV